MTILICIGSTASCVFAATMIDYTGQVFPPEHALNTRIDSLPVHPNSDNIVASIGADDGFHPDFGTSWNDGEKEWQMGLPYNVVGEGQPLVPITWTEYGNESDPGPWPVPDDPLIETVFDWRDPDEGDRHLLVVDSSGSMLYEAWLFNGRDEDGEGWEAANGAVFDLSSCDLRHDGWTSGDAAGLPIFPLLIRYDEVERALETGGEIPHAIRFTVQRSRKAYIWPARHYASSSNDEDLSPMGLRFRLKDGYDISGYTPRMQVILRTFKKYGIIVADNGGNWFFQGTHDDRWDDGEISSLRNLQGSDFEAVDISSWMERPGFDENSAAVPSGSGVTAAGNLSGGFHSFTVWQQRCTSGCHQINVRYTLVTTCNVRVEVSDLTGRSVLSQVEAMQRPGKRSVRLDAGSMNTGIYCVRVTAGKKNRTVAVLFAR
jgi:hypothetical protein